DIRRVMTEMVADWAAGGARRAGLWQDRTDHPVHPRVPHRPRVDTLAFADRGDQTVHQDRVTMRLRADLLIQRRQELIDQRLKLDLVAVHGVPRTPEQLPDDVIGQIMA